MKGNTMSKIKDYIVSSVEKQVDKIIKEYVTNLINLKTATDKIFGVDNIEMVVEKHNVEEMLIIEKEDYWKKANKEGRSQ
jgi:Flp pilus assembly CpaF family ATPase